MITRGSRLFFGMAIVSYLSAIVYGIVTNGLLSGTGVIASLSGDGAVDTVLGPITFGYKGGVGDHVGYVILLGFAALTAGLGTMTSIFRDGNAVATAAVTAGDGIPPARETRAASYWPLVAAVGVALILVGLATEAILVGAGALVLTIAAVEWLITAWADGATGDPEVNRRIRNRLMFPVEIPVGALLAVVTVVFLVSRILLTLSKNGAIIASVVLAAVFFVVAVVFSYRPHLRRQVVVVTLLLLALAVLGLGVWGAVKGPREFEDKFNEKSTTEGALAPSVDAIGALTR